MCILHGHMCADRPLSTNKRASYSEDHVHTQGQHVLLSRGRQSFIAAAVPSVGSSGGGFGSAGRGRWDSEDSGGGLGKHCV